MKPFPTDGEHHAPETLGTRWVAAGEGATTSTLCSAIGQRFPIDPGVRADRRTQHGRAFDHLYSLGLAHTNLALTGRPLTATDLERIARCEVK